MSERNVERIHQAYAAFNRGDFEAALRELHEEVEFTQASELPGGGGTYRGREGVRTAIADLFSAFEEMQLDIEEVLDLEDRLVALIVIRGKGKGSGAPFEARVAHTMELQDDRVIRWNAFMDRRAALASFGL